MEITYEVIYSDRKKVSIIVERDRSIIVRAPFGTSPLVIEKLVDEKRFWLFQKVHHPQKYPDPPTRKEFVTGESLLYFGRNYQLEISPEDFDGVRFHSKFYLSHKKKHNAGDLIKSWYIDRAKEKLPPRILDYAEKLGVKYNKILVSDLKYTWASCTPNKTLNFNWRIIKAPWDVINYIIVHELAHLIELNHSPAFWNIVAVQVPNYDESRDWLKKSGGKLEQI